MCKGGIYLFIDYHELSTLVQCLEQGSVQYRSLLYCHVEYYYSVMMQCLFRVGQCVMQTMGYHVQY